MQDDELNVVTTSEMADFVTGLFKTKKPKVDPNWDLHVPDASEIDSSKVEYASENEVTDFISGLFGKT